MTKNAVLFGGTGFIGTHLADYLLEKSDFEKVILADIEPLEGFYPDKLNDYRNESKISIVHQDVREDIREESLPSNVDLVVNLAAVHREVGHEDREYFETNILGAKNITEWVSSIECHQMVFMSSIAPYGPSVDEKTEGSLPQPETPYGISKLVAEKIHENWMKEAESHKLLIIRPGVVFGPGESGNVTRLVKAVLGGYFFYMGNKETEKAGGYVKDLCRLVSWGLKRLEKNEDNKMLVNFTLSPTPTIKDYVEAACEVANKERFIPNVPSSLLITASYLVDFFLGNLGIDHPFRPDRVKKSLRPNNISGAHLDSSDFEFKYSIREAFEDWKDEKPDDWTVKKPWNVF